ncbi:hypothetical protein I79_005102 [Cricetulus griseus]|uniref:Uncharacterized protein n=1 Tax=Cricetulus griseus TaxID=10029 RepID=G3H4A2_CRIGR|nr:hypothetical protein I79_005102 [Cricetulus griseus]
MHKAFGGRNYTLSWMESKPYVTASPSSRPGSSKSAGDKGWLESQVHFQTQLTRCPCGRHNLQGHAWALKGLLQGMPRTVRFWSQVFSWHLGT